jgi:hypothetical protein
MSRILTICVFCALILITISPLARAVKFDYSKPFPISLLDYPSDGGQSNPWLLDVVNIQVNHDSTSQLQNEEMVAINPTNTDDAVAVWRDFRLGYRRIGAGYTMDAGQTWHDTLMVIPPYPWQSDPVLVVDTSGNYYACFICLNTQTTRSGIYVEKSTDNGVTWSSPVMAVDSAAGAFEDKQMMVINKNPGANYGDIHIAWARFTNNQQITHIMMVTSTDGGQTYNDAVEVSPMDGVQWPVPTIGPNGDIYVAWFGYFPGGIYFAPSHDHGQSFDPEQQIETLSASSENINGNILVFPFPALTCDINPSSPNLGNLYIAFMDRNSSDMDIFFIRSQDGGQSWSDRIRINDDVLHNGADQFHPWLSVDNSGVIHAIFYDRRLDVGRNLLFDVYYTKSTDGGLTWLPNERITTVSSDPRQAITAGLIGEYIGLSAWNDQVQMVWTDTRNGNQDVFSGRMAPTGIAEGPTNLPKDIQLENPYPNPFNGTVQLSFYSPMVTTVKADVIDLLGRNVKNIFDGFCQKGTNRLVWNGIDASGQDAGSGIYFIRVRSGGLSQVKKAVMLR